MDIKAHIDGFVTKNIGVLCVCLGTVARSLLSHHDDCLRKHRGQHILWIPLVISYIAIENGPVEIVSGIFFTLFLSLCELENGPVNRKFVSCPINSVVNVKP